MSEVSPSFPIVGGDIRKFLMARSGVRHAKALLLTIPALAAAAVFKPDLSFSTMTFDGGRQVFLNNLSTAVLFPYLFLFMHGLGTLFMPAPPLKEEGSRLTPLDADLVRFFSGAGLLTILGFTLGVLAILTRWVTIPILCIVLYAHFLRSPDLAGRLFAWISAAKAGNATDRGGRAFPQYFNVVLQLLILGVILYILLAKGILLEQYFGSVIAYDMSFIGEVLKQRGIWMDPLHPHIYIFLDSRGAGVHLFFASIANQFAVQIVSVVYAVSMALVVHRVVSLLMPGEPASPLWSDIRLILPQGAMLLTLCSSIIDLEFGKYHLQAGAFFLFLSWASLYFLFLDRAQAKWLFIMLLPVAAALPIIFPQHELYVALVLGVSTVALYFRRGREFAWHNATLLAVGMVVTFLSLLFNWIYLGIPSIQPNFIFAHLVDPERFRRWGSVALILYVNMTEETGGLRSLQTVFYTLLHQGSELFSFFYFRHAWVLYGLSIWLVVRFRAYLHLAVILLVSLGLTTWLVHGGLIPHANARLIEKLGLGLGVPLDPAIYQQADVFFLFLRWAAVLYLALWLIGMARAYLSGRRLGTVRRIFEPNMLLFISALFIHYLGGRLIVSMIDHGSLKRLFNFQQAVFPVVVLFLTFVVMLVLIQRTEKSGQEAQAKQWGLLPVALGGALWTLGIGRLAGYFEIPLPPYWIAAIFLMALAVSWVLARQFQGWLQGNPGNVHGLFTAGFTRALVAGVFLLLVADQLGSRYRVDSSHLGGSPVTKSVRYFLGLDGLVVSADENRWTIQRCPEIGRAVPGPDRVLPLNIYVKAGSCMNTPVLPRGKVIDDLGSITGPYFKELVFGRAEQAYAIYRELGVNYFYVEKGLDRFWGPGYGESFNPENLMRYFDVFWEDGGFYILTWRGNGVRPVSEQDAAYIEGLREHSRTARSPAWLAVARVGDWLRDNEGRTWVSW